MISRIILALVATFFCVMCVEAQQDDPKRLDQAIDQVIQQREYQWRMPREVVDQEEQGLLFNFLESVAKFSARAWKPIADLWRKFTDWLSRKLTGSPPAGSGREWTAGELNTLIMVLITVLALAVLFFVWRHRRSKKQSQEIVAEPVASLPDIADEHLVADELPEEGWQNLARDLLARGELRLALRAFFMATLAQLADARLITIARFKSNREYHRELLRRAYDRREMQTAFEENVSTIDRVWYGMYPVTEELIQQFIENSTVVKKEAA